MAFGDAFFQVLTNTFGQVAKDVLRQPCVFCDRQAVPKRCSSCGSFACAEHSWWKIPSFERLDQAEVLCDECVGRLSRVAARQARQAKQAPPAAAPPVSRLDGWRLLGLERGKAKVDDVKRAFLDVAKLLHPDHAPPGAQDVAARLFSLVNEAKESVLEEVVESCRDRARRKTTGSRTTRKTGTGA